MDRLLELLERPRIEAEPGQVELQRILVEDAEDGLLAEDRGQHRHPEVDLARAVAQLDGLEPLGRCQQLVQYRCGTGRDTPCRRAPSGCRSRPSGWRRPAPC